MTIKVGYQMDLGATKSLETLMRWYRQFRVRHSFFLLKEAKKSLPPFSDLNPDVANAIKKYPLSNLGQLNCEMVSLYPYEDCFQFGEGEKGEKQLRQ
jgi:hypothetical protein